MIAIMRKFSIKPSTALVEYQSDLTLDKKYPVLAISEDKASIEFLIADDCNELQWVELADCLVASIDD